MSPTTVLITGANTGLGLEIVRSLLKSSREYHIFLGSRSVDKGQAAVAQLKADGNGDKGKISVVQIDISDDASIENAYKTVSEKVDHVDVLVNNAGKQAR
jgi:NAD(P)-dependent dehydrogenase (short-subunit alcohol dehydrogenase family)